MGAAVLAPLLPLPRFDPAARAAGVFADETSYLFDPGALEFEPDPALWMREGGLTPVALPDRGLAAAGVGSTLSYTHFPPPLPLGLDAGLRAQLFTPPVPDNSGAWLDDAISARVTLDDGRVQITLEPARDPSTGDRLWRIADAADAPPLPFPWDNGYANILDVHRRTDGQVAVTATNLDPAADGMSQTLLVNENVLQQSSGRVKVQFHWDRGGRSDSDSSCWVRVGTLWAGKGWGIIQIPRIGQEVIVDFLEGDPDRPIVVGSVYNADRLPPFPQPADPRRDVWRLRTSSGGGFHNEFTCIPDFVSFDPDRQLFVFKSRHDGAAKVEMRFLPIEPPFVWGMELAARKSPSLFPLALARTRSGELASVLHVELQIGDMTGSQTYPLRGADAELSFRGS